MVERRPAWRSRAQGRMPRASSRDFIAPRTQRVTKDTEEKGTKMSAVAEAHPLVGVIMGSKSDWDTMSQAAAILSDFGIPHEAQVVSAHRTPAWMAEYATSAVSRGLEVIIAGAGG